mgnify:CR=1 FL=1
MTYLVDIYGCIGIVFKLKFLFSRTCYQKGLSVLFLKIGVLVCLNFITKLKKDKKEDKGLGDCINCTLCVQVCPTGIDIPGEAAGLIPDPEWKEKTYHKIWLPGETLNTSIGQGSVTMTPSKPSSSRSSTKSRLFNVRDRSWL